MKWIKKNLTYNTLFLILTLFCCQNSYSQFTAYSTQGTPSDPDCGAISTGTEIWGGMGVINITQCVNAQISITNYVMVPYGPGWFGDTQGELYWYDGTKWKQPFNTTCGGGGGGCNSPPPNTWFISTTGDDASGNGSDNCPYATLSKAISAAAAGDVINIASGTYGRAAGQPTGWQNLTSTKALTIIGAGNSEAGSGGTVIDNDDRANERLIYFINTKTGEIIIKDLIIRDFFEDKTIYITNAENDVKLINITINSCINEGTNGNVYIDVDASNKFTNSDSVIIKNCIFLDNTTDGLAAGDYPGLKLNGGSWGYGNALIESTTFSGNSNAYGTTSSGRMLYVYKFERLTIKECRFTDNDNSGYVLYINGVGAYDQYTQGDVNGVTIENCVFDNNDIRYNSIYFRQCKGTISNSTFAHNASTSSSSIATNIDGYSSSTYPEKEPDFQFYNCIFHTTDNGNYNIDEPNSGNNQFRLYNCLVEGGHNSTDYTIGANVVSGDPLFTSQLNLSLSIITSPAVNVGCDPGTNSCDNSFTPPSSDMNNGVGYRNTYTPYDLGAYESTFTCDNPIVNSHPSNETICNGATPTNLSTSATGGTVTYQWYSNTTNSSNGGSAIGGEVGTTYSPSTSVGTVYYYCIATNNCGTSSSNVATIIINSNPTNTITVTETSGTSNDGTICNGSSVTLDAGSATTYLWDNSLPATQTSSPSPSATTEYNVTVTDVNGCTTTDNQIIIVTSAPSISGVSSGNVIPGGTLSFDATITDCDMGSSFGPNNFTSTSGWSSGSGFGTSTEEACDGNLYRDNSYSSYPDVYFNNSTSFLTSNGSDITVSFKYKCYNYSYPYSPVSTTDHKGQSVAYATSSSGPWLTVYTMTDYTASASCVTKTFTFTPTSGQPVFLRFHTLWNSGDFWSAYDDISVVEGGCTYAWTGPNSYTATTEDITVTTNASSSHAGNYGLSATNSDGCATTVSASITVNCPITVDAGSSINIAETQPINLDATVSCTPNSGTVNNEDIGSGNYPSSMTTFGYTPGSFWRNAVGDASDMFGESNITTSSNTGPNAPNTGDDYIYFETSVNYANSNGDIVYLESKPISNSGVSISFYYHMFGSEIGQLEVESYDGNNWVSRWSKSGQQHSSGSTAWTQATIDLSSYTVTQLRFKYTAAGGYYGDAALDDIIITYNQPCVYTWTTDAANGTAGWSATNTEDITVTNSATTTYQGTYTLTVDNGICSSSGGVVVTVLAGPPTWTGGSNTSWTDPTNWENNVLPTSTSDVVIGSGSNVPAVTTNVTINSLTIDNGSSLTIANMVVSGTKFTISKNLTVNGILSVTGDVPLELTGAGLLFGEYGDIICGPSSNTTNMNLKISGLYNIASNVNLSDLEITGTLKGQTFLLGVNGDWKIGQYGIFTAGTGKVKFNGSGIQTVTTKGQNFNDVEINNTNNPIAINVIDGIILGTSGVLKLTDGVIKTVGTAPFAKVVIKNPETNAIVGSDGTPHNLTPSSYVWGNLKRHTKPSGYSGKQKYEFPIGIVPPGGSSIARYYRARVDFTGLQGVSHITARFIVGNHPAYTSETDFANEEYEIPYTDSTAAFTLARMLGEGYWRINPNQQPISGSYDIVFFTGVFDGQGTSGKTAPVKTDTSNTTVNSWSVAGNLASDNSSNRQNSHGKIKSYGLTSFSDFGVGDGGGAALPIELLTFTVTMDVNRTIITWTTATEINNDLFTVERTLDGINFEEVLEMPGAGNSFEPLTYNGYDEYPLPGTSYYRLKQTDYDGQFEYSGMVELYNPYISNVDFYDIEKIGDNIKISYNLTKEATYKILVYDMMGKIINEEKLICNLGSNKHLIDISEYASGTYFVTLTNPYEVYSENIFISN